jgi:CCR4-NOT transcription complex subunit 2
MFYSSPRDALQEVAAQELYVFMYFSARLPICSAFLRFNRNWRYHKELRHWITKETGTSPSQKVQGGEQGTYTFWDPDNWQKERKDMTVLYADLEEKNVPAFISGPGLVLSHSVQPQNQTLGQGQAQQQQVQQRGSFQMGMAGL